MNDMFNLDKQTQGPTLLRRIGMGIGWGGLLILVYFTLYDYWSLFRLFLLPQICAWLPNDNYCVPVVLIALAIILIAFIRLVAFIRFRHLFSLQLQDPTLLRRIWIGIGLGILLFLVLLLMEEKFGSDLIDFCVRHSWCVPTRLNNVPWSYTYDEVNDQIQSALAYMGLVLAILCMVRAVCLKRRLPTVAFAFMIQLPLWKRFLFDAMVYLGNW